MNETYLYPYSVQEAKKRNQLPMWRESFHANVACRNAIEETIRQNFDGMHLKKDCLEPVLAEYGYKRTEWVLATTLQELSWDGRFSQTNKQWAARRYIPQDERHNAEITVRSHPAILDGFVDLYRKAYQELGLFGPEHCVGDRAEQDYIGIPIFHMEAGNRCKDECLPEETNRRIVDIISDVNLCYSEHARRYLMECGLPKERTFVTGSPMAEVLHANLDKIEASDIHQRLGLTKGRYILLSAHREENIDTDRNFLQLFTAVNAMAEKYDMPILYSCHPRSRKRLEATGFRLDSRVIAHEPLGFHDYNCLQMNAFAVVSDSGTLPEESSFFLSVGKPFPAISIRTSTERPEALDAGCFILAGIDAESLLQAVKMADGMQRTACFGTPVEDYTAENVSMKVARIIQSYTGIVNKMVWRKDG